MVDQSQVLWLDYLGSSKADTIFRLDEREAHLYWFSQPSGCVILAKMCLIGLFISKLNMNIIDFDSHVRVVFPWNIKVSVTLTSITKWKERRLANCTSFSFPTPTKEGPMLDHIFIWLGPAPPTPPSLPGLHARTYVGTPPRWGTNVTIPGQNHKYSSWYHFHYSLVSWWSSFTCQKNLMA